MVVDRLQKDTKIPLFIAFPWYILMPLLGVCEKWHHNMG